MISCIASWRLSAARIVEELFSATPAAAWDDLLELRQLLRHSEEWQAVLDQFFVCRQTMEADHYVPFFRLRRLLETHLRLVTREAGINGGPGRLASLSLWRHQGFADLRRRAQRDHFEIDTAVMAPSGVRVEVVESR